MLVESSFLLILILFQMLLASAFGLILSAYIPWRRAARVVGVPAAVGLALGPFLLGIAFYCVLVLVPDTSLKQQIALLCILFSIGVGTHLFGARKAWLLDRIFHGKFWYSRRKFLSFDASVLAILVLAFVFVVVSAPVTQNDALEYAIVANLLAETGSIESYPPVSPESTSSGFYGPWTHPPLYVVLLYLARGLASSTTDFGLGVLVSPWFMITSMLVVYTLGRLHNRIAGFGAATLFMSTPLLVLGASSGLIDALPVSGFLITTAILLASDKNERQSAIALGLALGFALWTHSQAVLFVPITVGLLFLRGGVGAIKWSLREACIVVIVALLVGAGPYIKNVSVFGALIADDSPVFSSAALAWDMYFEIQRGLDTLPAKIQYGVFKGWFSIEAFGAAFWLSLMGLTTAAWLVCRQFPRLWRYGFDAFSLRQQLLLIASAIVFIYLFGTVLSIVVGTDLMIKNERYLLVIIPVVCLLAGMGLGSVSGQVRSGLGLSTGLQPMLHRAVVLGMVTVFGVTTTSVLSLYLLADSGVLKSNALNVEALEFKKEYLAAQYLRENTPPDTLVFTLKPADLFYAERRMLSYLDPKMVPIYDLKTDQEVAEALLREGVSYLHVPDYALPPQYNSEIGTLLGNPALAELVFFEEGYQLYALKPSSRKMLASYYLGRDGFSWVRSRLLSIGGRKPMAWIPLSSEKSDVETPSISSSVLGLFHRDFTTISMSSLVELEGESELILRVTASGKGKVKIWVVPNAQNAESVSDVLNNRRAFRLTEFVLNDNSYSYSGRFMIANPGANVRILVEHEGNSSLSIQNIVLEEWK